MNYCMLSYRSYNYNICYIQLQASDDTGDFFNGGLSEEGGDEAFLFEGEHAAAASGFFYIREVVMSPRM